MKKYDVIIVGAGPAGYFCAYELTKKDPNKKILLIDKGRSIADRKCPVLLHKINKCPINKNGINECYPACSITNGFGGAGAYSDGKFNITTEFGGWLQSYMSDEELLELINYVDSINLDFGATQVITNPNTPKVKEIEHRAMSVGVKLLRSKVRHLGTEENLEILKRFFNYLKDKIDTIFEKSVTDIIVEDNQIKGVTLENGETIYAEYVVLAVGREGAKWLNETFEKLHIKMSQNQVDIGVRVEMKDAIWKEFSDKIYEPKILYKTKTFEDRCRMFCFNKGGLVSAENNHGIITANGHSYAEDEKRTENCNFAILSSIRFTEPFNQPTEYAESISRLANMIGKESVIVQRFGDLIRGRRTNDHRLGQNTVEPTLKATAGDISLVLPHRILTNIIETIYALDKVAPGTANDDTLLYGCESKYYSIRPHFINNKFELTDNIFIIGDGSGICRGLSQSGAMGIYVADCITQ